MNKLYGDGPTGKVLALVLEPGNIHKMVDERLPIELSLNEGPWERGLPAKLSLVIMYSETPVADATEIRKLLEVKVEDRRTPVTQTKRPHCPQCRSTIEQMGVWRSDESPVWLVFCTMCGCTLGVTPPVPGLERSKP